MKYRAIVVAALSKLRKVLARLWRMAVVQLYGECTLNDTSVSLTLELRSAPAASSKATAMLLIKQNH